MTNIIRRIVIIACFAGVSGMASAQEWVTDLGVAQERAAKGDKVILMVFQGSDWCAPCIKLSREVWETEAFKGYAAGHFVMLQVDFPRQKKHALPGDQQQKNSQLAEKYNQNGVFPLVVILDTEGRVLGETGYLNYSPEKYIEHLNSFIQ